MTHGRKTGTWGKLSRKNKPLLAFFHPCNLFFWKENRYDKISASSLQVVFWEENRPCKILAASLQFLNLGGEATLQNLGILRAIIFWEAENRSCKILALSQQFFDLAEESVQLWHHLCNFWFREDKKSYKISTASLQFLNFGREPILQNLGIFRTIFEFWRHSIPATFEFGRRTDITKSWHSPYIFSIWEEQHPCNFWFWD